MSTCTVDITISRLCYSKVEVKVAHDTKDHAECFVYFNKRNKILS